MILLKKITNLIVSCLAILPLCFSLMFLQSLQAQTKEELLSPKKNQITTYGMGYSQQRYSDLKQIDRKNIKTLSPTWAYSMENLSGEQSQPLVYDGVLYVTNAKWTMAVDIETGRQVWRTQEDFDPAALRVVCCGVSNKGAAIYDGKLFRMTIDAHVKAMDLKTGKVLWKKKFAEWQDGFSGIAAPLIANGVLISGTSGAEFGVRGFLDGWDPQTGQHLWRRYTTPAPGEKGSETWPQGSDAYKRGGATPWITGSYDPETDLTYWGTGNGGAWNPIDRPGDNLYIASVIAVRPGTGEIVWHYQFTPGDPFDFDAVNENILADIKVNGKLRKVLIHADKNAFLYVLDRVTGELLAANEFAKQNWAKNIDLKTGRPVPTDLLDRIKAGEEVEFWPGPRGGKNWVPMAFNPKTGLVYLNGANQPRIFKFAKLDEYKVGQRYQGVQTSVPPQNPNEPNGFYMALDPLTAKPKWKIPLMDYMQWGGMLVTDGGLLFSGKQTGEFVAFDAENGKKLWEFQTGSGINAPAITYEHKGRQYVTVLSGRGGGAPNTPTELREKIPLSGMMWTFSLPKK
ncbi:PQQ-dependent dehydrogenase, methanol/ethanol family [Polynucleobacter rarus]|uniref:PQQ-dependent dehydrogenase, methanol/ethanol family n=1 Tax=Polynucleobacter rarus TaxID=556055 RepID=UPI000D3EB266|nr:PQQ-dependent dehydrogenase, methanol/ethanol family [Polynucleobacter rarus]